MNIFYLFLAEFIFSDRLQLRHSRSPRTGCDDSWAFASVPWAPSRVTGTTRGMRGARWSHASRRAAGNTGVITDDSKDSDERGHRGAARAASTLDPRSPSAVDHTMGTGSRDHRYRQVPRHDSHHRAPSRASCSGAASFGLDPGVTPPLASRFWRRSWPS
jgi:hypothetical protein